MLALIDADLLVYRVGYTTQAETEGVALARLESSINLISDTINPTDWIFVLSPIDHSNYRYLIDKNYKANRKDQEKPVHFSALRKHLQETYNARVAHGEEADDLLGILQYSQATEDDSIIVSIDKDLNQIAGNHFNFVNGEQYYVSPVEGLRWFYKQMLIGDTSDNVKGIKGIGPAKAGGFLNGIHNESEMYNIIQELYISEFGPAADNELLTTGQLLWIRRKQDELWQPPE